MHSSILKKVQNRKMRVALGWYTSRKRKNAKDFSFDKGLRNCGNLPREMKSEDHENIFKRKLK